MRKTITTLSLAVAAGLALAACQKNPTTAFNELPQPIGSTLPLRERPRSEMIGGPADGYARTTLLAKQRLEAQENGPERMGVEVIADAPRDARPVSLAFNELAAKDALRVIIGELLGRSYIIDPEINGELTLNVEAELSTQDVYDLLDALCVIHGWSIENRGQTLVVRTVKQRAASTAAPILSSRATYPSERPGVRLFPVRYLTPQQVGEAIKPLLSTGGVSVIAGRSLVVADTIAQLNRLGDVLKSLDKPAFSNVEVWTYELAYQAPSDAARVLETIATQSGLISGGDAMATFVVIPRSQRLMVISRDPSLHPMIQDWVEMVDQSPEAPQRHSYVYHIQHVDPGELKTMLDGFYAGRLEDPKNPLSTGMRITVSREEDLLLIQATPQDYADLMSLLERVDRSRQQVHLQAVIAEVTLSDSLEYGVEYFLSSEFGSGLLELAGPVNQFSPANPAGSAVFLATSGFAVIEALKTQSNVAVLSTPSQFVRDKAEATLKVGAEVPIITAAIDSQTQVGGTTGVRNEVEYRDTGVIFGVTPSINERGEVTMRVKLEVTDAVPTTSSGIDSPTFTTRTSETTVTVPHGKTVLIGGAIETRTTDRRSSIPLLGDIPAVGQAFTSRQKQISRTELLLAITPTIVNDPADTDFVMSEFVQSAYGVRDALRKFVAPIPDVLRTAHVQAIEDAANALAHASSPVAESGGAAPRDFSQLVRSIPDARHDDEAAAVALFLKGLAARLPQDQEG